MTVITISRTIGSRGDEIARRVCEALDLRYFDKRLMAGVAHEVGLSPGEVVDFSEQNYRTRNFLERLLRPTGATAVAEVRRWREDTTGVRRAEVEQLDEKQAIAFTQATVEAAYKQGDVLIVGRGGQAILQGRPEVLHVRIEAPLGARIEQIRQEQGISLETAEEIVNTRDKAAAAYLHRFYEIEGGDPTLYHLILNSSKLGLQRATAIIVAAVEQVPTQA